MATQRIAPKRLSKTASNRAGHTSDVPGVYFRDDGSTRWIVKFRDELGKTYRPQVQYPVDLAIKDESHPLNVKMAKFNAEAEASRERAMKRAYGKSHTQMAQAWTLGQMLEKALEECQQGKITIKSVRTLESNLRVWLGKAKVGHNKQGFLHITQKKVTKLSYEDFYNEDDPKAFNNLLKGRDGALASNSSVVKMLKSVQYVFKRARTVWKVDFINPMPTLNIEVGDARSRVLSDKEWEAITSELKNTSEATRDAIFVTRYTAMRRAEAVKLDWGDVNWDDGLALLRGTKSKTGKYKERLVPITNKGLEILQRRFEDTKDKKGPVFAHERKGKWVRIGVDTTTQAWTRARQRAATRLDDPSILTARVHDLRHTRITEMGSMPNITIAEAARVSGHDDLRTFMRYFNPDPKVIGKKLNEHEAQVRLKGASTVDDAISALLSLPSIDDIYLAFGKAVEQAKKVKAETV